VVLGLMQQGKSNLAIINHFTTQDMELTLEQVLCGGLRCSKAAVGTQGARNADAAQRREGPWWGTAETRACNTPPRLSLLPSGRPRSGRGVRSWL
jgi:hypothetical protein